MAGRRYNPARALARAALLTAALCFLPPARAQEQAAPPEDAVGLTLKEVFALYGQPDTVHSARGAQDWQDDVVFVYKDRKLELYVYKDRVWQASVEAALGVRKGERKTAAALALSGAIEDKGTHLLYKYSTTVWPKYARFNIDANGRISAIYIYRPDY